MQQKFGISFYFRFPWVPGTYFTVFINFLHLHCNCLRCNCARYIAQKMKLSIKHFFSKCDQIRRFLRIWSHFFFVQWCMFIGFRGFLKMLILTFQKYSRNILMILLMICFMTWLMSKRAVGLSLVKIFVWSFIHNIY